MPSSVSDLSTIASSFSSSKCAQTFSCSSSGRRSISLNSSSKRSMTLFFCFQKLPYLPPVLIFVYKKRRSCRPYLSLYKNRQPVKTALAFCGFYQYTQSVPSGLPVSFNSSSVKGEPRFMHASTLDKYLLSFVGYVSGISRGTSLWNISQYFSQASAPLFSNILRLNCSFALLMSVSSEFLPYLVFRITPQKPQQFSEDTFLLYHNFLDLQSSNLQFRQYRKCNLTYHTFRQSDHALSC